MKKGKSVLTRRVLAGLLAWVLLGSVGYVQPAAAQTVEINTNEEYAQAGSDVKDSNGHIRPSGSITGNQVTIGTTNGGDVPLIGTGTGSGEQKNVYGGHYGFSSAVVDNNHVYIISGQMGQVYGGYAGSNGAVTNNKITVTGGTITDSVIGGYSNGSSATGNKVDITDGTVKSYVIGGYSNSYSDSDTVTGNSVTISKGTIEDYVKGGYGIGKVEGNSVTISGGEVHKIVYGGDSINSTVVGNILTITGGTIGQDDGSGMYTYYVAGGNGVEAATDNIVIIEKGTVNGSVTGGAASSGKSTDNKVYISGGTVKDVVYGGYSAGNSVGNDDVMGNLIVISGNGEVAKNVYGGFGSTSGAVTGNEVRISGGIISGSVYGGYGQRGAVTDNSVTISGAPKFGTESVLYGGATTSGTVSGNILNIHTKGLEVANVKGFDVYNFYLQNDTQAGNTLLTLTGGNGSDKSTSLDGSTINVGMEGSAPALQVGDSVILVKNENGITGDVTYGKIKDGVSIEYEFTTELEGGTALVSRVTRAGISADSKSPVETQLAAVAFINSGADLLAGSGVSSAVTAAGGGNAEMFGAMSGGSMRYKSGSYADVHGYNLALGVGKAIANKAGQLTFGPFVEYGHGNYTSYLDSGVRGDGNTKYYGIGMLARQDNTSGVYYEGSLRYGRMDADYGSNDMTTGTMGKVHTHYDSSSAYYGAHLGIGKVTELDDSAKADIYAKLLYTHQRGDSVTLQGQGAREEYDFDAVDSTRARVGARVSKAYGERGSGYVGVAYEYEFDGEARAAVKGFSTPSPSIKGSSGLLELGYILQPKAANDPAINIGLQGWGGKKQGFTGNVNFVWTF